MNTETPNKVYVVRELKKLKDMTSMIRKILEDCNIEKNLYFETSQKTNRKFQCDSLISEDSTTVLYQFIKKWNSLSRVCNKTEKDIVKNKEDNVNEIFYDGPLSPILNSKYCNGTSHIKQEQQETQRKKIGTIFPQHLQNFANGNPFVAKDRAEVSENFKIGKMRDDDLVMDSILIKNINIIDIMNNSSDSFGTEVEEQTDRLIMVEIYRRISNFFEIGIVTPVAMKIENYFEVFEFGLAIIVCAIYMFFTNAKKELGKKLSSRIKKIDSYAKSPIKSEFSTETCKPVKKLDSMEPLIVLKSRNNSKEDLNIPCETEYDKNVNEINGVKQILTNSKNTKYGNGPRDNYQLSKCEEEMPKLKHLDEFDSLLLAKCEMYPNCFRTEIEEVAKDNRASEGADKKYEKLEENAEVGGYFTEISDLDLKNELIGESTHVFNKETDKPESPSKEGFYLKDSNTLSKEIELIEFGNQSESVDLLLPVNEKEENVATTEKLCDISDGSQFSNSFSAESRLLDIDEKLVQEAIQSNAKNVGTEKELEEKHVTFLEKLEQHLFSEKSETKYESIDITTRLFNNNLGTKTINESAQSCLDDLSDLTLYDQFEETILDEKKTTLEFESCFSEYENKDEANIAYEILIGDSSICGDQDKDELTSLLHETSSTLSFVTVDLNNTTCVTEYRKMLTETTEVPIFINNSKIIVCAENNLKLGDNSFEKVLPKNQVMDSIKISYESNNSSHESSKDDYSKPDVSSIENYIEFSVIEELSEESLIDEKVINFSDPVEECGTTDTTYTYNIEHVPDVVEDLNLKSQTYTRNVPKLKEIVKLKYGEEINSSYLICNIERLENKNCSRTNTLEEICLTVQNSQEFNDTLNLSLEVNGSFQCLEYMESSEENIENHSYDIVTERKNSNLIKTLQEKTVDLDKAFSSSLPDIQYIDDSLDGSAQELSEPSFSDKLSQSVEEREMKRSFQRHITQEKTVDLNKAFSSSLHDFRYIDDDLDGSAQELLETSFSDKLSQSVEEREMKRSFQIHITQEKTVDLNKTFSSSLHNFRYIDDYLDGSAQELSESQYVEERGIKRSFQRQNLPRIYLPTFVKNWEEDRKEDIQSLLSDASESFKMGTQSSSFNNVEANFTSEGKNSPEKHEAFTCSPSYASETSEMGAPSSNSNTASNFVSKVKAVHETKDDFKCLPFYEEELLDMEAQSSSYNNAAANSSSEVKAESKKPKTQKSFRSKMFSMFNGVRKFHGRMLTAAREYENYKKQNNQTNDSLH